MTWSAIQNPLPAHVLLDAPPKSLRIQLPLCVFKRQYNSSALRVNAFIHVSSLTIQASEA